MLRNFLASSILALAIVGHPASAAEYVLDVKAKPEQTARYEDGREVVDDVVAKSSARIFEPKRQTPRQSGFRIYVQNNSESAFNFGPENVTVRMPDGTEVAMLTYQDLISQQKKRETWQAIAQGFAAASRNMQASQAGNSYGTANYSGNSFGTIGSTPYSANSSGMATYSTYNAGDAFVAQSIANEQNRRDMQAMQMNQASKRADLDQVMKMNTVDPGQVFGGIVQYKIPSMVRSSKTPVPVTIEIQAGDEVHIFQATLAKYKS